MLVINTTIEKFCGFFFKNFFFLKKLIQGHLELMIKNDSKDDYDVKKYFYFK